jgi:hypothetical protein
VDDDGRSAFADLGRVAAAVAGAEHGAQSAEHSDAG